MNALCFNTIPRKGGQYPDMDHVDKIYLLPRTKFHGTYCFYGYIHIFNFYKKKLLYLTAYLIGYLLLKPGGLKRNILSMVLMPTII